MVEVDEVSGFLFVAIDDVDFEYTEATGTLFVKPFAYLEQLRRVYFDKIFAHYRSLLPASLHRARTGEYPRAPDAPYAGLDELRTVWDHEWGVLWGPPGTGKTRTVGEQVAELLACSEERILIVSTTNKATDAAALSIGAALKRRNIPLSPALVRVGRGADWFSFKREGQEEILEGSEAEARFRLAELRLELTAATSHDERARIRSEVKAAHLSIKSASMRAALDPLRRAVVTTAFNALALLVHHEMSTRLEAGRCLFTTVILDEAGLLSRATTAALALLAANHVLLVGDPKQLAPISTISRLLPPAKASWLAMSGLSYLSYSEAPAVAVRFLSRQYRMAREVCDAVSAYQYEGRLESAPEVDDRPPPAGVLLSDAPRAIWYVLDEDCSDLASVRAERAPSHRGWVRSRTPDIIRRLFSAAPELAAGPGLFLSPFVAQTRIVRQLFAEKGHTEWRASTVHAQQGAETDYVIFDTVNAGSHVWSSDDWKRLVNVGLSRAREFVFLLATRQEMAEPYLRELKALLAPRVLRWQGSRYQWQEVPVTVPPPADPKRLADPASLGAQLAARQAQRPVLSKAQQRLCVLRLDGKPRLVRGVAGSGKTVVLAHWVAQILKRWSNEPEAQAWVVYANRALKRLLEDMLREAWAQQEGNAPFPAERLSLWHVADLLRDLYRREALGTPDFDFDYERGARRLLEVAQSRPLETACDALFVDEAQDMGHDVLHLLTSLVSVSDTDDPNSRSAIFFYDNAQNLYDRGTPRWSDFGLDMRGRSTVLTESFRSTRPNAEYALNVLYRLCPPTRDADHQELVRRRLIERTDRNGRPWWRVRFNQIDGPSPVFRSFLSLELEIKAVADRVVALIRDEAVCPSAIRLLYVGRNIPPLVAGALEARLGDLGARFQHVTSRSFPQEADTVVLTTPHSFKGYEAEVVLVLAADQFVSQSGALARPLYVALTRARSILEVYASDASRAGPKDQILTALSECLEDFAGESQAPPEALELSDLDDVLDEIGQEHRDWLTRLARSYELSREPLVSDAGEILGQPVFWFRVDDKNVACLGSGSTSALLERLEDAGVSIIEAGESPEAP
ncbi:MAG: AAA family ATPase [Planctomycetes bacterium]|nr:AAA family ATPase [Planctomycetota bacterium]